MEPRSVDGSAEPDMCTSCGQGTRKGGLWSLLCGLTSRKLTFPVMWGKGRICPVYLAKWKYLREHGRSLGLERGSHSQALSLTV